MDRNTPQCNAFTVDLEEWFQGLTSTNPLVDRWHSFESRIVPATEALLALLATFDVQATFFVLGYVADQQPALVERIHAAGHEIGVHGYWHRFVHRLTPGEFASELADSIAAIERITGQRPIGHRAPYFSFNGRTDWAFSILRDQGIRHDSSIYPVHSLLYGYPDAPRFPYCLEAYQLMEYPVSTLRWSGINWPIGGGFYGRLLPYAYTRSAIRRLNQQGQPAILYLHPWELDLGQRYNQITWRERITHYYGRRHLAAKLTRLFTDFRFTSLRALLTERQLRSLTP